MTDTQVVSAISRFFLLTHLDEHEATVATTTVLYRWRAVVGAEANRGATARPLLIRELNRYWTDLKRVPQSGQPILFDNPQWSIPSDLNLGPWLEFRRTATPEEIFAVLTVRVLNMPEDVVAGGVGVQTGTIRHRLARGLRRLGHIQIRPGPTT